MRLTCEYYICSAGPLLQHTKSQDYSINLQLADWLEELAVFGSAKHMLAAETAHHLCQAMRHLYLVRLAIASPRRNIPRLVGLQNLEADLQATGAGRAKRS